MKLSVCLAVYNEVDTIHYALDSCYDFADEIIIVDGGSDDGTREKIKLYGAKIKIFYEDNPPMFHINKQKALDKAKGDWILQLDADEAVSPDLKKEILKIIEDDEKNPGSAKNGYWIPRANFFLGRFLKKGGQYPDYTIRLYKNGKAHLPAKSVHEQAEVEGGEEQTGYLQHDLQHHADPTFDRYLMRWNRYTSLDASMLAKEWKKESFNPTFLTFLNYIVWKPKVWFLWTYLRHKGFMDGFPGFVFSLFSSIRFWVMYVKAWHLMYKK
jgi:glycosyltransferase involved in cell wall biosynthesis